MSQESPSTVDELVERTAEQIFRMAQLGGVSGDPRPAVEQLLHHAMAEARELEMQDGLGHTIRPIQAVAIESVIDVLRSLDFAPIFLTSEANGRYA